MDLLIALVAAALVAVAAQLSFPLPGAALPQTAQTLAVLLVGATLGMRRGVGAIVLYILVGAAGAPVFAEGNAGLGTVLGPSAGYLLGFVVAAAILGACKDRDVLARSGWHALGAILAAHALILLLGGALLVPRVGFVGAWTAGVAPFLLGGVVKSALAALVVAVSERRAPKSIA